MPNAGTQLLLEGRLPPIIADGAAWIEDPDDEDYARAARWALGAKRHRLALEQVAAALALAPDHEPHQALAERIIASTRAPLQVLTLEPGEFFGLCALRGRALARLGRFDEAVEHVLRAATFEPTSDFIGWSLGWARPRKHALRISPAMVLRGALGLIAAAEARAIDPKIVRTVRSTLELVRALALHHVRDDDLAVAGSRLLRALGREAEAVAWLEDRGHENAGAVAVERAALAAAGGDQEARAAALSTAVDARPDASSLWLDLGIAHLARAELAGAAEAFARAISLGNGENARSWAAYAAGLERDIEPGRHHEETAVDAEATASWPEGRLGTDLRAFVDVLPDPIDPLIGVIRSAPAQIADVRARLVVRAERAICPSARLAWMLAIGGEEARGPALEVSGSEPADALRFGPLWTTSTDPSLAIDGGILGSIFRLAARPFSREAWRRAADDESFDAPSDLVLLTATQPRSPFAGIDAASWVIRWQLACCLLSTRARPANDRLTLHGLLEGPDDWSSIAAVVTLGWLASTAPSNHRIELVERLTSMLPLPSQSLPPCSRALAITGARLATDDARPPFLRLRMRIVEELEALAPRNQPSRSR